MYTELAKEKMNCFSNYYPKLYKFYSPHMGNFSFLEEELSENIQDVLNFLKDFDEYKLIFEEGHFFLTNFS